MPPSTLKFDGADILKLAAILANANILFASDAAYWTDGRKVAHLASAFEGPAAIWLGTVSEPDLSTWEGFQELVRSQFGLDAESAKRNAVRRLASSPYRGRGGEDLLVWMGEHQAWTTSAGIVDSATRAIVLLSNLPDALRAKILLQVSDVSDLTDVLKELREGVAGGVFIASGAAPKAGTASQRPRCGRCKKRGHAAKDCRAPAPKT